ncbi:hypothetical protein BGZ76_000309 [Entomortierella beljakovae]|nr:hypothetical protein BGZ76_000309 [Entomortierella beljakovae]
MSKQPSDQCGKCLKEFASKSLRNHIRDYHPCKVRVRVTDETGRIVQKDVTSTNGKLICPICNEGDITTRPKFILHVSNHLSTDVRKRTAISNNCHICNDNFATAESLEIHYDEMHPIAKEDLEGPLEDSYEESAKILHEARVELDQSTMSPILTNCMLEALPSYIIHHKSGPTTTGLLTQAAAKREATDPIIRLEQIKKLRVQTSLQAEDLNTALKSSRYGNNIDSAAISYWNRHSSSKITKKKKEDIARNLAGAIVHTGLQIIPILKAEVYGRDSEADPHSLDFVKPTQDVKVVAIIKHDNCRKIVMGTLFWSSLITSSIELNSGRNRVTVDDLGSQGLEAEPAGTKATKI